LKTGVPVIGLGTWEIEGVQAVESATDAGARALATIHSGS
jgi:diketogulonate reductase-like aldo/keto reductase